MLGAIASSGECIEERAEAKRGHRSLGSGRQPDAAESQVQLPSSKYARAAGFPAQEFCLRRAYVAWYGFSLRPRKQVLVTFRAVAALADECVWGGSWKEVYHIMLYIAPTSAKWHRRRIRSSTSKVIFAGRIVFSSRLRAVAGRKRLVSFASLPAGRPRCVESFAGYTTEAAV